MQTNCLFCGTAVRLILVHGHYQCPLCKTNALPCCDGNTCNDLFLTGPATGNKESMEETGIVIPDKNT